MRRFRHKQRQKILDNLAALPDSAIDTSDIPELTEEQFGRAIRQVYRPSKRPVTKRLDAEVIEWLKHEGPGYQTKANFLLRREMLRPEWWDSASPSTVQSK